MKFLIFINKKNLTRNLFINHCMLFITKENKRYFFFLSLKKMVILFIYNWNYKNFTFFGLKSIYNSDFDNPLILKIIVLINIFI